MILAKLNRYIASSLVMGLLAACGTRVGNPKKPDEKSESIKIPTIAVEIPDSDLGTSTTANLSLTADNAATTISNGVPNSNSSVESFNDIVEKVNEGNITLNESFSYDVDGATISGIVKESENNTYKYAATFCSDGKKFLFVQWNADQDNVYAVRSIDNTPIAENRDRHKDEGEAIMQELLWKKSDPMQFRFWQTKAPPKRTSIIKLPVRSIDAFKFRFTEDGVAEFTGVTDLRYEGDEDDMTADLRFAGQIRPDKKHFYLAHMVNSPLLCNTTFDEDNGDAPGFCVGIKRRELDKPDYSILSKTEVDTAWSLISDIEISKEADLKEVAFPNEASCSATK